jgi:hypothetical protein
LKFQQVAQLEAALIAQRQGSQRAAQALADAEKQVFQADKQLNEFISKMEDAQTVVQIQAELDKDR